MENSEQNEDRMSQVPAVALLLEIEEAMAESQRALLGRRLVDIETCTLRLKQLGHELREVVAGKQGSAQPLAGLVVPALSLARDQGRLLSALLRRMRRNLEVLRHARQGCSQFYTQLETAERELHY